MKLTKQEHQILLAYSQATLEMHDRDRDGDDWWTAFTFQSGKTFDLNVYYEDQDDDSQSFTVYVTAYPVNKDGEMDTDNPVNLIKREIGA